MAEEEAQMPQDPAAGGDAAAGADAAAGGEGAEEKPAKKGGGIGAFLPLILMPVLCAGMAAGVWYMVMNPQIDSLKKGIEAGIGPPTVASADGAAAAGDGHAEDGDHAEGGDDHGGGDSHGEEAAEGEGGAADDPDELVPIVNTDNPTGAHAVVINPKGTGGTRYLVAEIYLRRSDEGDTGFKSRVAKNTKALEELTRYELEDRTIEDLQKRYVQEEIRMTLLSKFNNELKAAGHQAPVKRIYFSKWVMQ